MLTLEEKNQILFDALKAAGTFFRQYPPAEMPQGEYENMISVIAGGSHRDPIGLEFMVYFIQKVKEEKGIE